MSLGWSKNVGVPTRDLLETLHRRDLVLQLGATKPILGLRSTFLGPFWIMASFGVFVAGLGLLWSRVLATPIATFLPHVAIGLLVFVFLTGCVIDGARAITSGGRLALQNRLPIMVLAAAAVAKQLTIALYSSPVVITVLLLYPPNWSAVAALALPGTLLMLLFASGSALALSMVCVYVRDLTELLAAIMRFMFFLTPVIWLLDERPNLKPIAMVNPFHHAIHIIRAPVMGGEDILTSFAVMATLTLVIWAVAWQLYARTADQILLRV